MTTCPHCSSTDTTTHTLIPMMNDVWQDYRRCNECNRTFIVPYHVQHNYSDILEIDEKYYTSLILQGIDAGDLDVLQVPR